ncbi:uncharacterized protein LOC129596636 [Paramacrobiotus metropolitanus]|uniref:uncharacterized protein LOC129596636 n=1 Tax=Paramacrobiotus metropolitanus TaxID=2943436 RepID=UPI0024460DF2|nr:uncharacterized protein LOC129596636 [Paramacrobiotus metropolitanus]
MFIYGPEAGAVDAWNAVDVLVDGVLQHGRVINVVEKGLIVDFDCETQRAQFVEYGRIFHLTEPRDDLNLKGGENVQALVRAAPDGPWQWFPGRVARDGGLDFCVQAYIVEAQLPHGAITELLPRQQVRFVPSNNELDSRRIQPTDFQIRSCLLSAVWFNASRALLDACRLHLQRKRSVWWTKMSHGGLWYVQRSADAPLQPPELEAVCMEGLKKHEGKIAQQPLSAAATPSGKRQRTARDRGLPLAVELLVETFQSLHSIDRTRHRRVCALWNQLLTTEAYFPVVRISCQPADCPLSWTNPRFWTHAVLLHCVNRRTTTIVLTHMDLLGDGEYAASMIPHMAGRIPRLVLYQCFWSYPGCTVRDILAHHSPLMKVCSTAERVVWSQCRVREKHLNVLAVSQHSHGCQPEEQLRMQLWDLFEKHLIVDEPVDRNAVSEWMKQCAQYGFRFSTTLALHDYQSADPRPSNCYRCRRWTPSDVEGLDIYSLSPLAATALHRVMMETRNDTDKFTG